MLALDHRGHGRGIRALENFDLEDCADDAAGVLRELGIGPAVVAGYSMGGPISLLTARRHPDVVRALVLCATSSHWSAPRMRLLWWSMAVWRLVLGVAPYSVFRGDPARGRDAGQRGDDVGGGRAGARLRARHRRGRARVGPVRRAWLARRARAPAAVVVTTRDRAVPPGFQRDLARRLDAAVVESKGDHLDTNRPEFTRALLAALQVTSIPPSTGSTAPVTYDDASLARKTSAATSSTGSPARPAGTRAN